MSKNILRKTRRKAYKFVITQAIFVLIAAFIAVTTTNIKASYSLLLGGMASIVPTLYFTYKLFREMGARSAKAIIKNFYVGEITKLVLMGIFFVIFIKLRIVEVLPFVLGFIIAQLTALIAPIWYGIEEYKSKAQ